MSQLAAETMPDPLMARWLRNLVPKSRHRARRANLVHELEAGHGQLLFEQQAGICAISGLPFALTVFPDVLVKHPFAPSLDRISSYVGYTATNVRLVCIAVNLGMGQWGEELYLTFARAAVACSDRISAASTALAAERASEGIGGSTVDWVLLQRERIAAAETVAATLTGEPLSHQRRRIASLRRNLKLEPEGLRLAGLRAAGSRALHAKPSLNPTRNDG